MGRTYTEEIRGAVMAALLTGQSVSSIAKQYNLPKGTVSEWKQKAHELAGGRGNTDPKKAQLGALLLDYLGEALKTLRKQVIAVGDENYIKQQPASEIAVLHGVIADKSIRLLEALADDEAEGEDL
jgi:transposase-like protein